VDNYTGMDRCRRKRIYRRAVELGIDIDSLVYTPLGYEYGLDGVWDLSTDDGYKFTAVNGDGIIGMMHTYNYHNRIFQRQIKDN
jgi:hypothetical protein